MLQLQKRRFPAVQLEGQLSTGLFGLGRALEFLSLEVFKGSLQKHLLGLMGS